MSIIINNSPIQGLRQKKREILQLLKDDLAMRQIFLQKILDKKDNDLGDEIASSAGSATKPKSCNPHDSRDPYDM